MPAGCGLANGLSTSRYPCPFVQQPCSRDRTIPKEDLHLTWTYWNVLAPLQGNVYICQFPGHNIEARAGNSHLHVSISLGERQRSIKYP